MSHVYSQLSAVNVLVDAILSLRLGPPTANAILTVPAVVSFPISYLPIRNPRSYLQPYISVHHNGDFLYSIPGSCIPACLLAL